MIRRGRKKQRTLLLLVVLVFDIKVLGMAVKLLVKAT
jgi:hypothetical protein